MAGDRADSELRTWLESEFRERFRYLKSPPEWIQAPAWPIGKNGPLFFLGQLDIKGYFHDDASAYVFYDESSGLCETIVQVY